MYYIKKCPKISKRPNKGFYYLSAFANSRILVLDNPSSDKHWQGNFFFLSRSWSNEQRPVIKRNSAKAPRSLHNSVPYGVEEVRRIRRIVQSDPKPRAVDAILTYERIARARVIPFMLAIGRIRNPDLAIYLAHSVCLHLFVYSWAYCFLLFLQIHTRQLRRRKQSY